MEKVCSLLKITEMHHMIFQHLQLNFLILASVLVCESETWCLRKTAILRRKREMCGNSDMLMDRM